MDSSKNNFTGMLLEIFIIADCFDKKGIIFDRYCGTDKDSKRLNDMEEKFNTLLSSH